ncbi:hypothetical protein [Methylocapsa acidiphila]|uniref:hypothetical protein n=1 Tax=Methylocapsa acidiphila TaxID=133552 RepID=UPI00041EE262|nr:hypothetical protein [Methylocapsa acidiphila]
MNASAKMSLKQKVIFFAVLIIGAIIWKFGSVYFVKSEPEDDSPYEVEQMDVKPIQSP